MSEEPPLIALVFNLKRKKLGESGFEDEGEFDSPSTIEALRSVIADAGYDVVPIEATRNVVEELKARRIDVVFNFAEGFGKRSREAQVPAICDFLGIEHTGSDATCMAVCLDKALTKKILLQSGIRTPRSILAARPEDVRDAHLGYPVIVKPNHEGTSKGVNEKSVVSNDAELKKEIMRQTETFHQSVLCEEYVIGREYTVGLLGNDALAVLGPMEIAFKKPAGSLPVYSFVAKQNFPNEICDFICPTDLSEDMLERVREFAITVFRSLECRDIARMDFRIDDRGDIWFLEVNPLPGLAPHFSDLVLMGERCGLSYENIILGILSPAVERWRCRQAKGSAVPSRQPLPVMTTP